MYPAVSNSERVAGCLVTCRLSEKVEPGVSEEEAF